MPAWNLLIRRDEQNPIRSLLAGLTSFLVGRDPRSFVARASACSWEQIDLVMLFNPAHFIEGKNLACYQRKLANELLRSAK